MSIFDDLKAVLQRRRSHDPIRAYLDASVSVADLERRQREIDRGQFPRR